MFTEMYARRKQLNKTQRVDCMGNSEFMYFNSYIYIFFFTTVTFDFKVDQVFYHPTFYHKQSLS